MGGEPVRARGWFADFVDEDGRAAWIPYLQNDFSGITALDIQFDDRETCEWFIRNHLVGQGWMDGPAQSQCPDCRAGSGQWCVGPTGAGRVTFHADRMRFQFGGWPK